ncbi:carboxylesterase family protein [Ferrimonas balearica]|nr:carboxylesterase family protein [Ferrimonas balearica]
MRYASIISLITVGLIGMGGTAMANPTARIATGDIAGKIDDGTEAFLGLPYAQPPVGALRWKAPQPVEPWTGTYDATEFGHDCAQKPFPSDAAPLGTEPAEDCLYLNVWRPDGIGEGDQLPVMVWIHGGGFINGGASAPVYDGAALARDGMVVVSINYRLGRFGFFAHPALAEGATDAEAGGNFGILDQAAALSWVKDNITALGGDPERITLVGESAGGRSVHILLTSPLTAGMASAAVIQSGGDGGSGMSASPEQAAQAARTFAEGKGIDGTGPEAAAALRALDAADVIDGLNLEVLFSRDHATPPDFHMPVTDGVTVVDTASAYDSGRFTDVPVMIGATSADIGGPDGMMLQGARDLAALMTDSGMPTWHYVFDYVAETQRGNHPNGAAHASEIPFFFGTLEPRFGPDVTELDRRASETAKGTLSAFVKSGTPNATGTPEWPRFGREATTLTFTPDGDAAVTRNN